ncbi:MAG: BlaI/MecI/CopY family transcriptional regulator [Phycisphaerales bacterium]|nr:BlaI/MecI/CopY family transcriptional regulator [Phycisphaerales bacterium]
MSQPQETSRRPTEAELAILTVIWDRGSATVREVQDTMSARQRVGYTTVLKLMQIMTEKGLLLKNAEVRPQVFRASTPKNSTQKLLLSDLVDRAFQGSPGNLVLQALSLQASSPDELREIRELLDRLEADQDPGGSGEAL